MGKANLLDQLACEKAGQGEEWAVYRWEAMPESRGTLVTGAVAPPYKSGPRKGQPNWQKRDLATERRIFISYDEGYAYMLEWERKTGNCAQCQGRGKRVVGWSRDGGNRYRDCGVCKGTGKAEPVGAAS
jgi:hypothetical protein